MYHATGSSSAQAGRSYPFQPPYPNQPQMELNYTHRPIASDFWTLLNAPREQLATLFNPEDQRRVEALRADFVDQRPFLHTDIRGAEDLTGDILGAGGNQAAPYDGYMNPGVAPDVAMLDASAEQLPGEGDVFRFGVDMRSPFAFPRIPSNQQALPPGPPPSISGVPPFHNLGPLPQPTPVPANQDAAGFLQPPAIVLPEGSMATPIGSRPSTPPLSEPILGVSTDFLRLNHIISRSWSGVPPTPDAPLAVVPPENWLPPSTLDSEHAPPAVPDTLVEKHREALLRTTRRAALVGAGATYNNVDAGSEFILMNPPDSLVQPLDILFINTWHDVMASHMGQGQTEEDDTMRDEIARRVGALVANDARIGDSRRQAKAALAQHLEETFSFAFDVLLGKKDSQMLQFKLEATPARAVERMNMSGTVMDYAHLACIVDIEELPEPITIHTRTQVGDFKQETTLSDARRGLLSVHHHRAHKRLVDKRNKSAREVKADPTKRPWIPNATQRAILASPPKTRFGPQTPWLLRVLMPGGRHEIYSLNFQAGLLLELSRFNFDNLHRASDHPTEHSVVWRFLHEQQNVEPGSANDLVWKTLLLPLAIAATGIYVARENIFLYFHGLISGTDALKLTPKAAVLFQAKLISAESVIETWLASPFSKVEYPLLRHRLLAIMADVVRPGDDFIGYDLIGASWTTNTVDHLAYGQSKTTRDHESKRNKGSLVTKAPTILEASYQKGLRSKADVLKLLKETSIEKPLSSLSSSSAST